MLVVTRYDRVCGTSGETVAVAVATHNAHPLGASVVCEHLGAVRRGERGVDERVRAAEEEDLSREDQYCHGSCGLGPRPKSTVWKVWTTYECHARVGQCRMGHSGGPHELAREPGDSREQAGEDDGSDPELGPSANTVVGR
jgi:hypothetical protein